ncbi:MAG: hypothetical protein ABID87_05140 [Chloroflexota bacterium]
MADATFDAVLIGGGNKLLATAVYLAKYGGMKVAMFERRHEIGGALAGEEAAVPGFATETHISFIQGPWYWEPIFRDFPDFEEKGGKLGHYLGGGAIITKEDQRCHIDYHELEDPSGERVLKSVAEFAGEKDAETYHKIMELNKTGGPLWTALREELFNPPPPPGTPRAMARWFDDYLKQPDCLADESWRLKRLYHAARELWDSPGMIYHHLRGMKSAGGQSGHMCGGLALLLLTKMYLFRESMFVVGGTHNIAHAYAKILLQNGGQFFTKKHVDKILVENGRATGIRLADGSEVRATQLVVSGLSPFQLVFDLLGEEHVSARIRKKISCLSRREHMINWSPFAVREMPQYLASGFNPDIQKCQQVHLGTTDTDDLVTEDYWRLLDKHHPGASLNVMSSHSVFDKSQAPDGKGVFMVEEEEIPANLLTERQWMARHQEWIEKVVTVMREYAPNVTWDNIIGYYPNSPFMCSRRNINTGPEGMLSILDTLPGQTYPWRPIPELARHKVPEIERLYCTGSGWGFGAGGCCGEGYNCYKIIAGDMDLRKPWEETGSPW